jgi:hypothetical protein
MKTKYHSIALAPTLALVLLFQGCAVNFARDFRLVLAASGPLVNSLPLGNKKAAVVADFSELAGDASTMADEFNTCGASKPCKLNAVSKFESEFEIVDARGHFGLHPKLQTVEGILKGIIASARIYYGGTSAGVIANGPSLGPAPVVTEADLKAQLKDLKAAMRP